MVRKPMFEQTLKKKKIARGDYPKCARYFFDADVIHLYVMSLVVMCVGFPNIKLTINHFSDIEK